MTSRAIIEDCRDVRFAPYSWDYEGLQADYKESGLIETKILGMMWMTLIGLRVMHIHQICV